MFLLNSCLGLFSAATSLWHPFSRSYGVILPSSLTTLLPPAFEFSSHLPVSVCGTGMYDSIAAFLDSLVPLLPYYSSVRVTLQFTRTDLPIQVPLRLHRYSHSRLNFPSCVPTVLIIHGTGISASSPSTTALALALGPDFPRADHLDSGILRFSA